MLSPVMVEVDGQYQMDTSAKFKAILSDGASEIEIIKAYHIEGAKIPFIRGSSLGYAIYLNNKAIAAVQYSPSNLYI
jgi:hypothetical protein